MSPQTFRKIKAMMIIVLLSVAEGHRIQTSIGLRTSSKSSGAVGKVAIPLGARFSKALSDKSEATRAATQITTTVRQLWTHASEKLVAMLSDPDFHERGNLVPRIVEVLKQDSTLQQQARSLAELTEAMQDDPNSQVVATRVTKDLEALMAHPKFQEQLEAIERQLETDPKLHEQLSAMMEDPSCSWEVKLVLKKMAVMKAEPAALLEVSKSDVQGSAGNAFSPLHSIRAAPSSALPVKLPSRVPVSDLVRPMFDSRGHNQRGPEPTMSMSTSPKFQKLSEGKQLGKGGDSKSTALAAALALTLATSTPAFAADTPWSYSQFLDQTEKGGVEKVSFSQDGKSAVALDKDGGRHDVQLFPGSDSELVKELRKRDVPFAVAPPQTPDAVSGALSTLGALLFNLAPLLLLIGLSVLSRRGEGGMPGGGGMNPFDVGKSRSKIQMEPSTGVTFDDVAGCDGSKQELTEIVEFLKNPAKFSALGAKIPRGAIMEGPPGTGKTLLARAVAGEANVPFVSASGSEFVEMFVGVGASRVRDLFEQAKKNAPCIVFIDEIDAIGRSRAGGGGGMGGGGNDEREQTLNQILTEMDGFDGNTGVIVLAATNRADVLDSALLRPGRFDRRIPVDLPDVKGRREILNVHVRGKPLAPELDLDIVAKRCIGFSGASLANLMNEAAIVAARRGKSAIGYEEVDYAIDRQTVGMEKSTGTNFPARQRLVAFHEAGHALMALLTPDYDMVTKVTIIPRSSGAGGFTLFTPSEEQLESGMYTKRYLENQLAVALAGRVAEEVIYGPEEITTGASNDLQQVRNIARRMVSQWGFANENIGEAPVAWEVPEPGMMSPKTASEATEVAIDAEVQKIVQRAYKKCFQTLSDNKELLIEFCDQLIEKETMDYKELQAMMESNAERRAALPAQ